MSKKEAEAAAATREKPKSRPRYTMAELLEGAEASGAYPLPPEEREWCRFQKTAALNVRSRLHYSSGGVGSIRQRRAAAGHQRTQGGLS
ncbi:hypothetical protein LDY77_25485, partial [Serratia marcescens]|nr:hypothetical protein [Serratia marcescens]